jgi:hypothetical protein
MILGVKERSPTWFLASTSVRQRITQKIGKAGRKGEIGKDGTKIKSVLPSGNSYGANLSPEQIAKKIMGEI